MTRHTGPSQAVLDLVTTRNGGMCLRCGWNRGEQCHHRKPRGMGGTRDPKVNEAPNLVWICSPCHRLIESRRSIALATGWLVQRNADPTEQYLIDTANRMLMLLSDGGVVSNQLPSNYDEVPF